MRHARPEDLDRLDDLLTSLRALPLVERTRGVFYRRSRAFLHFHEHDGALFADIRGDADFDRFGVTAAARRRAFLAEVRRRCA
jgi:hypothetical protein